MREKEIALGYPPRCACVLLEARTGRLNRGLLSHNPTWIWITRKWEMPYANQI